MTLYRVELLIETPHNPEKWEWSELIASEMNENIEWINIRCESSTAHMDMGAE